MQAIEFYIGSLCNNNCLFCKDAQGREIAPAGCTPFPACVSRLSVLKNQGGRQVTLTGGEPTLHPQLLSIIQAARKIGFERIAMLTNGRTLSYERLARQLVDAGMDAVCIAVHGATPRIHDGITRTPGSFSQTVSGLRNISACCKDASTHTVVCLQNYRTLPEILDLVTQCGVNKCRFSYLDAEGNAAANFEQVAPKLTLVKPYLEKLFEIAERKRVDLTIDAVPLCVASGSAGWNRYLAAVSVPDGVKKKAVRKNKTGQCERCGKKESCKQLPLQYLKTYGTSELSPFVNYDGDRHVEVNIGKICNNRCVFCLDGSGRKSFLPFESLKKYLLRLRQSGYNSVGFIGGEPTVYPEIVELVSFASRNGFSRITMVSNGRRLKEWEFAENLVTSGVTRFSISIHSHLPSVEDVQTGVPGGFAEKLKGLRNLAKLFYLGVLKEVVGIAVVVNQFNINALDGLIEFFAEEGIDEFRFNCIRPSGNCLEHFKTLVPRYRELGDQIPRLIALAEEKDVNISFGDIPYCTVRNFDEVKHMFSEVIDYFDNILFPESESPHPVLMNWKQIRNNMKQRVPACRHCLYDGVCEGPWKKYAEHFGDSEFSTIGAKSLYAGHRRNFQQRPS